MQGQIRLFNSDGRVEEAGPTAPQLTGDWPRRAAVGMRPVAPVLHLLELVRLEVRSPRRSSSVSLISSKLVNEDTSGKGVLKRPGLHQ